MKPKSAKAKARRLQDAVYEILVEHFRGRLDPNDLRTAIMGESGEDIKRSPLAKRVLPFSFECKNQEKLNIWSALEQAQENADDDDIPAVIFKRNRSDIYISMKFADFLRCLKED
jgi:hypothetical protein